MARRWLYLLPAVYVTYSLAYLDRANYGFGAAAGLAATLHISSAQSALLGSLFFFGYFLFQIPGISYAQRHSASRLIFYSLLVWGMLAAMTGVVRSFWLLALDRMLLGVAESLIFPAMLLLLTRWFTRAERSRANTLLILGNPTTVLWMSAITGYLIHAVGWQMTFVLEGLPSVAWAFAWRVLVRDRPEDAPWMATEATEQLNQQLLAEQSVLPAIRGFARALLLPRVQLLTVVYFCWSAGLYGFVIWLPTIIRAGSTVGIEATGLLSAVPYLLSVLLMLLAATISDRTQRRSAIIWPSLLASGVALLGSFYAAPHSFWMAYGCLILAGGLMYAPYGPFFALIPELVPRNVTAQVLALVNSAGALGAFAGAGLVGWLQGRTGSSQAGFLLMAIALMASGVMMLFSPEATRTTPGHQAVAGTVPQSALQEN
ncbi:MAG: MFS transporter [Acidobacteriota bacterium]|nr:MFS transporter [Acidobacteriota bacterium]